MNANRLLTLAGAVALCSTPMLAGVLTQPEKTPTLKEQPAQPEQKAPPETTAETVKTLTPKTGLPVGWHAPQAELKNDEGETVKLQDWYAKGPTVVAFYRGGWCPFCNKQLKDWQNYEMDFKDAGINVIFITPESVEHVNGTIEKTGTTYTVLSDSQQQAAKLFNVIFQLDSETQSKYKGYGIDLGTWNANAEWNLPVPGVFLIDTDGVVRWQKVDEDYKVRVNPEEVLEAAGKL